MRVDVLESQRYSPGKQAIILMAPHVSQMLLVQWVVPGPTLDPESNPPPDVSLEMGISACIPIEPVIGFLDAGGGVKLGFDSTLSAVLALEVSVVRNPSK